MEQSILTSTKKVLNIASDDTSFDLDIMTFINSAFSTLNDLGVGPDAGYVIEDDEPEWSDLGLDMVQLSQVKTYVWLRVRMMFDPPQTSYLQQAMTDQIASHEWRLNARREAIAWQDPNPPAVVVIDE
jgi:hypothetical protein